MIEKIITVKTKNGTTYTQTIKVYDTCEEYYSKSTVQDLKRKIRRIEQFLDDLTYIEDHTMEDDGLDEYRELAEIMRMTDEF